jgi:hypothetical protein
MSDLPHNDTVMSPSSPDSAPAAKAPWHPPTVEEVDYSATEASGVGGVYDFIVYSGSTGP